MRHGRTVRNGRAAELLGSLFGWSSLAVQSKALGLAYQLSHSVKEIRPARSSSPATRFPDAQLPPPSSLAAATQLHPAGDLLHQLCRHRRGHPVYVAARVVLDDIGAYQFTANALYE